MVTGVPMITWPVKGDQMLNSQLCVEILKIAIVVHKKLNEIVGQEEIERVVRLLMEDTMGDVLRKKAKEVSQITQNTFLPRGSSRKNLDLFVKELNSLRLINK
jgi:UDP:flavonoid glycosyltransferase YjiC (YdhE family)